MINEYIYLSTDDDDDDHNRSRRVIYRNKILLFSLILIIYSCSLKPTNTTTSTSIKQEQHFSISKDERTSARELLISRKNPMTRRGREKMLLNGLS